MSTLSPNMSLPISTVAVDSGLNWELNLNAALTLLDQHTHAPGSGIQIQPSGININTDFPFNNNNATTLRSVRFQTQASALALVTDKGCLYESGVDLYYNDGSGNQIRITQSGSIAGASGTITGLPSGTASASFASSTFVFQSATNTAANIDGRNTILRNSTANSKGLTLTPPSAMAADFSLILPSLPGSTSFLTLDTSGNITGSIPTIGTLTTANLSASANITGSQLSASAGILGTQITAATITNTNMAANSVNTTQLVNASVTPAKRSTALSASAFTSSGAGINTSSSIPCTFVGTGRPIIISMSILSWTDSPLVTNSTAQTLTLYKNGSVVFNIATYSANTPGNNPLYGFSFLDVAGFTGSVTYDLRVDTGTLGPTSATLFLQTVEQ